MPNFTYKARDSSGKAVKGAMEAATREELVDKLRKMGYMATMLTEARGGVRVESFLDKLRPIGAEDMILFYIELSNMINAGITLLAALDTISEQISNRKLKDAVSSVARAVEAGDSFSQALSGHTAVFPKLLVNMVKAGEVSGKLDTVLARFAQYFEHQIDLREKIKAALFYPVILLVSGLLVTLFIVTFVIPQFAEIFMKSGIRLPIPTLILYHIGIWIKEFWYLLILAAIGICTGVRFYLRTKRGRYNFDRVRLKIPILGPLHRKACISGFAKTLGTLVASGVPILESLNITRDVIGNEILACAIENAQKAVEKGEKIAEPLRVSNEFPPDMVQMVSVGEETGNLDGMLEKLSDFYDMTVGYAIKKMTTILEPLFLVIMGSMVGFIMASMLLPMFDMIRILRR